jgi:hypothetical protein
MSWAVRRIRPAALRRLLSSTRPTDAVDGFAPVCACFDTDTTQMNR